MPITFEPQFHQKITNDGKHSAWLAMPHPFTIIAFKAMNYHRWQIEERQKLEQAGEIVLTAPLLAKMSNEVCSPA